MSVGGTGDLLSGCIAGLIAQGMSPWAASRLGCALLRTAGLSAALEYGLDCQHRMFQVTLLEPWLHGPDKRKTVMLENEKPLVDSCRASRMDCHRCVCRLCLIPICWRFWRRWDRPSKAAVSEMLRRIRERDVREAFIREDAKLREQQRLEAERELSMRKAQAPAPVEKSTLASAFGNLGAVDSTGTAILESSPTLLRRPSLPR